MSLISFKRLDLIVKYLYAQDILNQINIKEIESLYIRHILMRTGGVEPVSGESNTSIKNNTSDYIAQFKQLISNISSNGFDKNLPVIMAPDGTLTDGAHRLAASVALGVEPCIKNIEEGGTWDFDWFDNHGFNTEDKQRILKGFVDVNLDDCNIFVVWNPLFKYLDNVKSIISKNFDIVGEVELDFENNYIGFTNAVLDIYEPNISTNDNALLTILEKTKLLQAHHLSFKVIVVTNQSKNNNLDVDELSKSCKKDIRELFDHVLPKECFCTVHSSDSNDECSYLSKVLLSPNNIKQLKSRMSYNYSPEIISYCKELKQTCKNENIALNDVCVIGSGPMAVYGIKDANDLDIVIKESYRAKYSDESVALSKNVDLATKQYHRSNVEEIISDDNLISSDDNHFIFAGVKFANLDIIKQRKVFSNRDKDLVHLRLIELFENYIGAFDNDRLFKNRLEQEINRRISPSKANKKKNKRNTKVPFFLIRLISCFIPKSKNRKKFRNKWKK